mgnify:CR=1 FL=1
MAWDIYGHEWAADLLREHVAHRSFRQAYLFTGPQGVGRRTLALRFAQALNCPQPQAPGEPCRVCRTCLQIENMQHPDLAIVQAERKGGVLKVDQVRELQTSLSLAPYQAPYRVAILLRFEEAHPSASNALLKTLEEPPDRVVLMLTAESGESLLPTIVSRCELLRLRPIRIEVIQQKLETVWGIPPEEARLLAHLCGGRIGYAIALHQSPELLDQRKKILDDHQRMLVSNRVERFAYADTMAGDKDGLLQTLEIWQSFWRDVFLRASGSQSPLANLDRLEEIESLAERLGEGIASRMITSLQRMISLLEKNINLRLASEVIMLELPRLS